MKQSALNLVKAMSTINPTGLSLKKVVEFLENFASKALAQNWDNTGLLLEPPAPQPVTTVLLTNDLTEDVTEEAIKCNAQLIISYHPPIFKPLTRITTATWKERIIGECMQNRIALYSPHTAWDAVPGGINDWLHTPFDSKESVPILSDDGVFGAGRLITLKQKLTVEEVVCKMREFLKIPHLRLALARHATLGNEVSSIALCAGSGGSVLSKVKADLYLTGEMSHHEVLDAIHNGTSVLLCNHSNSERGFLQHFAKKLVDQFPDLKTVVSSTDKDPIDLCFH